VAHHALTADLKSITFEMNVTKTAKSNHLQIVSSVILQQHCRPVAPKSLSNAAHDLVQQFLQIEYGVHLLRRFLQQQKLTHSAFQNLICRPVHDVGW
jgi:hypothetical protein